MRAGVCLLIVVFSAGQAFSAPRSAPVRARVAELQQFLEEEQASRASDGDLAQKLAGVELSEQLTESRLAALKAQLGVGEMTATELDLLADMSASLRPPAGEMSADPPPDAARSQGMIRAAENFAAATLKNLPDFLATRTTQSFADVPIVVEHSKAQSGMHPIGTYTAEVGFRSGLEFSRESGGVAERGGTRRVSLPGLSSAGEFGPVLATVLRDSSRGTTAWSYWQKGSAGSIAVFRYDVPKQDAHYHIDICCAKNPDTKEEMSYHGTPAYGGFVSIDPATGDVLRVTIDAEIPDWNPPPRFGLLVSYGEVEISGKSLICPLRSAVTLRSSWIDEKRPWHDTRVNDVAFAHYRRFGTTAKVVPSAAGR